MLDDLTATAIAQGDELKGIKAVLNKVLDPAISLTATLLTNQTGFDVLDNMTDGTGRPLLEADPKTATPMLFKSKPVMMVADAVLPNVSGKAPIYVGDFRQQYPVCPQPAGSGEHRHRRQRFPHGQHRGARHQTHEREQV